MKIHVSSSASLPVWEHPVEYVERKGLGHPDSICDAVMEAAAEALSQEYLARCGRVLHHNLDKAMLVAGQSEPKPGGGRILSPMRMILGDRATTWFEGVEIPVDEIVEAAARRWFDQNMRFVSAQDHLVFQNEIRPGSAELIDLFKHDRPLANDTSAAVGYAPLSETERMVLKTEKYINSSAFKMRFPCAGEDVKVMAVRHGSELHMTIAIAFVDRFVANEAAYFEQKQAISLDIQQHVEAAMHQLETVSVDVNTLDDQHSHPAGMYLTVLGTSAEGADGGEVGRGNAVNGLISLTRPSSKEAAAGKNTICHVGNIYNHLAFEIANDLHSSIPPVEEAYVWLCSQIGQPIEEPWSSAVSVVLDPNVDFHDVSSEIKTIVGEHLSRIRHSASVAKPRG